MARGLDRDEAAIHNFLYEIPVNYNENPQGIGVLRNQSAPSVSTERSQQELVQIGVKNIRGVGIKRPRVAKSWKIIILLMPGCVTDYAKTLPGGAACGGRTGSGAANLGAGVLLTTGAALACGET